MKTNRVNQGGFTRFLKTYFKLKRAKKLGYKPNDFELLKEIKNAKDTSSNKV